MKDTQATYIIGLIILLLSALALLIQMFSSDGAVELSDEQKRLRAEGIELERQLEELKRESLKNELKQEITVELLKQDEARRHAANQRRPVSDYDNED